MPAVRTEKESQKQRTRNTPVSDSAQCVVCKRVLSKGADMNRHMWTHESESERRYYYCPIDGCESKFGQKSNVTQHLKSGVHNGQPTKRRSRKDVKSETPVTPKLRKNIISPQLATPRSLPATVKRTIDNDSTSPGEAKSQFSTFHVPTYASSSATESEYSASSAPSPSHFEAVFSPETSASSSSSGSGSSDVMVNMFFNQYNQYAPILPQDLTGKAQYGSFNQPMAIPTLSWSIQPQGIPDFMYYESVEAPVSAPEPTVSISKHLLDDVPQVLPAYESSGGLEPFDFVDPASQTQPPFPRLAGVHQPLPKDELVLPVPATKSQRRKQKVQESAKAAVKRNLLKPASKKKPSIFEPIQYSPPSEKVQPQRDQYTRQQKLEYMAEPEPLLQYPLDQELNSVHYLQSVSTPQIEHSPSPAQSFTPPEEVFGAYSQTDVSLLFDAGLPVPPEPPVDAPPLEENSDSLITVDVLFDQFWQWELFTKPLLFAGIPFPSNINI